MLAGFRFWKGIGGRCKAVDDGDVDVWSDGWGVNKGFRNGMQRGKHRNDSANHQPKLVLSRFQDQGCRPESCIEAKNQSPMNSTGTELDLPPPHPPQPPSSVPAPQKATISPMG